MYKNQKGFGLPLIALLVLLVIVFGFAGYNIYKKTNKDGASNVGQITNTTNGTDIPEINSRGDLDKIDSTLDSADLSTDSQEADGLYNDINSL